MIYRLLLILLLPLALTAETPDSLQMRITALDQRIAGLTKQVEQEKKENELRLSGPGKSEKSMQDAYVAAERLNLLNSRLNELNEQRTALCNEWKILYADIVDKLLSAAQKEQDREKKGDLGKGLQDLQNTNRRLCSDDWKAAVTQEWKDLRVESYDGPPEIRQKIQLLQDITREININLSRLDKQLQDFQREQKTKERAQEFIQESTLFNDNLSVRRGEKSVDPLSGPIQAQPQIETTASTDIVNQSDSYGKEQQEQFELQYQQKRKSLLSQKGEVSQKIREFEEQYRRFGVP